MITPTPGLNFIPGRSHDLLIQAIKFFKKGNLISERFFDIFWYPSKISFLESGSTDGLCQPSKKKANLFLQIVKKVMFFICFLCFLYAFYVYLDAFMFLLVCFFVSFYVFLYVFLFPFRKVT